MSELDRFVRVDFNRFTAQYIADRRRFERSNAPGRSDATVTEDSLVEFEECWKAPDSRLAVIPGKEALATLNQILQEKYGVNITATAILDAMRPSEVPDEMQQLVADLSKFALSKTE